MWSTCTISVVNHDWSIRLTCLKWIIQRFIQTNCFLIFFDFFFLIVSRWVVVLTYFGKWILWPSPGVIYTSIRKRFLFCTLSLSLSFIAIKQTTVSSSVFVFPPPPIFMGFFTELYLTQFLKRSTFLIFLPF